MGTRHCERCRMEVGYGEHAPWCPTQDPGERSFEQMVWDRLDEMEEENEAKINRLAKHMGLPPDWDDE